jgi:hypothetical protein
VLTLGWTLMLSIVTLQADRTVVLGQVERDLTGDGKPEILRVMRAGPTVDRLGVTFTIESAGRLLYRLELAPLTPTVGFDAGRRVISAEEHRARLKDFGRWFFAEEKFQHPPQFVDSLRVSARDRLAEIPEVIERDRHASDTVAGSVIWEEISKAPVTIFTFSPGGDVVVAIGWNARAGRFYRLLECCYAAADCNKSVPPPLPARNLGAIALVSSEAAWC